MKRKLLTLIIMGIAAGVFYVAGAIEADREAAKAKKDSYLR